MSKLRTEKNRNPWNTPFSESEPEEVGSESSSAEEADEMRLQEELEKKVLQ